MARLSEELRVRMMMPRCACGHWLIGVGPGAMQMPPPRHGNPLCEFSVEHPAAGKATSLNREDFSHPAGMVFPNGDIMPGLVDNIVDKLKALTDGQRVEVFDSFCTYCGTVNLPCTCRRDE